MNAEKVFTAFSKDGEEIFLYRKHTNMQMKRERLK